MNRLILSFVLAAATLSVPAVPQQTPPQTTLRVTSRAVLVDVIVTDHHGNPVTGLKQDDFSVTDQGKPQTISFFEEHLSKPPAAPVQIPKLPPDVFTNASPFPAPPTVNVLLLDSLNTQMADQSYVHNQALKFLKTAKPGSRMAIFTMGLGLHFIQGFTDDPAVLMATLKNKKNNEVESSALLKGQQETNAQQNLTGMMSEPVPSGGGTIVTSAPAAMITALQTFMQENDLSRSVDRTFLTLENLQRLATFLNGFPGRKNVIWFSEQVPGIFLDPSSHQVEADPRLDRELKNTLAMLAAARVALYPVDAGGVAGNSLYTAANVLPHVNTGSQMVGPTGQLSQSLTTEDSARNLNQENMKMLARESGGEAFVNTNGLDKVISKISSTSGDFYSLSYAPTDSKMDGTYRNIRVEVSGGHYDLSYRRGYYAVEAGLPGEALAIRNQTVQRLAAQNPGAVDPLLPFMDLGMPQSRQIRYKVQILPQPDSDQPPVGATPGLKGPFRRYSVGFAVDLNDLDLNLGTDRLHKGMLNLSLVVYDRYGNRISREDHRVALNIKPDVWTIFWKTGLQLKLELSVPKGNYWLRTGIYDDASGRVGTVEVPLSLVKPFQAAAQ
ncbi:MAG TPA: VWA domain-containing protein [Terracidiphilus sp.]|nr:VWA domain-containing protein [Terracidiphilus sp.]